MFKTSYSTEDLSHNKMGRISSAQHSQLLPAASLSNVFGASMIPGYPFYKALKEDLENGQVTVAEGVIEWHPTTSVGIANFGGRVGSSQVLTFANKWVAFPGKYRIYYLPRSGAIVALEMLESLNTYHHNYNTLLQESLALSPQDIADNQRGVVSERQRKFLGQRGTESFVFGLLLSLIGLGLGTLGLTVGIQNSKELGNAAPFMVIGLLMILAAFAWPFRTWRACVADRKTNQANKIVGTIRKHSTKNERSITVNNDKLRFVQATIPCWDRLATGETYSVFISAQSHVFLSIQYAG